MKPKILLCCICAFLFFSCKKDKKVTPTTKLYPISFNLSGFTQTQVPIGKAKTTSLTTQAADTVPVQSLVYMLFKIQPALTLISQQRIEKGAVGFGTFTDNVAPGDYTAVFIGGSAALNIYAYNYFGYASGSGFFTTYWDDTFLTKVPITVTASGINQPVTMKRRTARLDVILKDAIPAGTTKITVSFRDTSQIEALSQYGNAAFVTTNVTTKTINAADIGTTNYTITANTVNDTKLFDVTISYYGANPAGPLGTKIVKNVLCKTNTKTTLSGNLFTPGNNEFDITVNQDWNTVNVGF
jgi:hypothetical protein